MDIISEVFPTSSVIAYQDHARDSTKESHKKMSHKQLIILFPFLSLLTSHFDRQYHSSGNKVNKLANLISEVILTRTHLQILSGAPQYSLFNIHYFIYCSVHYLSLSLFST